MNKWNQTPPTTPTKTTKDEQSSKKSPCLAAFFNEKSTAWRAKQIFLLLLLLLYVHVHMHVKWNSERNFESCHWINNGNKKFDIFTTPNADEKKRHTQTERKQAHEINACNIFKQLAWFSFIDRNFVGFSPFFSHVVHENVWCYNLFSLFLALTPMQVLLVDGFYATNVAKWCMNWHILIYAYTHTNTFIYTLIWHRCENIACIKYR